MPPSPPTLPLPRHTLPLTHRALPRQKCSATVFELAADDVHLYVAALSTATKQPTSLAGTAALSSTTQCLRRGRPRAGTSTSSAGYGSAARARAVPSVAAPAPDAAVVFSPRPRPPPFRCQQCSATVLHITVADAHLHVVSVERGEGAAYLLGSPATSTCPRLAPALVRVALLYVDGAAPAAGHRWRRPVALVQVNF